MPGCASNIGYTPHILYIIFLFLTKAQFLGQEDFKQAILSLYKGPV